MEENIKETNSKKGKQMLELEFKVGDDIKTLYANEVAVQIIQSEVVLSFFEVRLPIKADVGKAIGQCVGRFAMPIGRIPAIIEALDSQFSGHLAQLDALEKSEGEANESVNLS